MNFYCIIFSALLAVTVADLRSRNFTHIQPIEDFPHLQKRYPDIKNVESFGDSRIVGGEVARPGQFPYQVRLFIFMTDMTEQCGASVISSEYALTAAHCVYFRNIKHLELLYGAHNVDQAEPEQVRVRVPGGNIIIHPQFVGNIFLNDIALIKLDAPIAFTPRIQPVALPTRSQASDLFEGENAIVSGWGVFSSSNIQQSKELRFIQLPIMPNAQCKKSFWTVTPTNICGDGAKGQSCSGDSGGPFVVNKNGKTILVGIVSFGKIPCDERAPSVFARITSYLDFIAQNSNIVIAP